MTPTIRDVASRFPSGVAIVSTRDEDGQLRAMTMSSFTVVSNDPPLVSVVIANSSASAQVFRNAAGFGVSLLEQGQESLARRFATPLSDKFAGLDLQADVEWPILADCGSWFDCSKWNLIETGDHFTLIGRVDRLASGANHPLVYCNGSFFEVGEESTLISERQRRTLTGWIVENEFGIILERRAGAEGDIWAIPMNVTPRGSSMGNSLGRSAQNAFGSDVEIGFIYSVIDVPEEHATCVIYRGRLTGKLQSSFRLSSFDPDAIPWGELVDQKTRTVLRRYVSERQSRRFGIYLHTGDEGRIAQLSDETRWNPEP